MKIVDITKPVMQKIVSYEKKKTARWLNIFFGVMVILLSVLVAATAYTVRQMIDLQTFDPLSLFREDREIIAEFWRDTLLAAWGELPQRLIITGLAALMLIILIIILTRTRRRIIRKKLAELAKYQNNK